MIDRLDACLTALSRSSTSQPKAIQNNSDAFPPSRNSLLHSLPQSPEPNRFEAKTKFRLNINITGAFDDHGNFFIFFSQKLLIFFTHFKQKTFSLKFMLNLWKENVVKDFFSMHLFFSNTKHPLRYTSIITRHLHK